ncbi:MAG: peptidase M20 [SAR116 cluster bacterium]|nr:peptidase M20 [SAR116 cluster bacterium]RPH00847.1 MAG: M20 family peptidase [Candidatus Puniceispirillum sp. TMED176]HBP58091.1 peptidase M20 [Alphaproteobacteria bacterium]
MDESIVEWLDQQQANMLALLKDLVDIDSNSFDKAGVDRVGSRLVAFFDEHEIPHETIPLEFHGDAIRAVVSGGDGNQPILLCGHRDTVFPTGEVQKRPFSTADGKAFGPGVADMKPGLVINAFILAAFHKFGGHPNPIVGLFTGDEEIGSPASKDVITAEAEKARLAFNSEPSRPSGNIVTRRKGGIFCRCEVTGVAAHSGGFFEDGRSAIEELARKVQALHALTDLEKGITINVGLVGGGQSVNTVAAHANCGIDIRYREIPDRAHIWSKVRDICETTTVNGTSSTLQVTGEFYPLNPSEQSAELFAIYKDVAAEDGIRVEGDHSGGCADSGFIAAAGTPVICGVGPVGGNYHRPDEWMQIDSLAERARFIAQTILRLASQPTNSGL